AVDAAVRAARAEDKRPSLICCKTVIGYGAPDKQGTKEAHGEALGVEEGAAARKTLGWEFPPFVVPDEIRAAWDQRKAGAAAEAKWQESMDRYAKAHPDLHTELQRRCAGKLPQNWNDTVKQMMEALAKQSAPQATRASSQAVLNVFGPAMPELLGG